MTEENIIYQLLDEARGGLINNDEVISERQMRMFLQEHRANIIRKAYNDGMTVAHDEFQNIGDITLTSTAIYRTYNLPNIIKLPNYLGIRLTVSLDNYVIPIVSKESFSLSKKNPMGQYLPKAYIEGGVLTVYKGLANADNMFTGTGLNEKIADIIASNSLHLSCILQNPDDLPSYDWTTSNYPLSNELITVLKNEVKRKNLNMLLQTKTDEVTNMKQDNIRYHDQGKID